MTKSSAARRAALTGLAAIVAAGLVLSTAAPAFAAARTVSTGDRMFAIDCEYPLVAQGYSVDSTTAALTALPEGNLISGEVCAFQAAYDAKSGASYFVDLRDLDGLFTSLYVFDVVTGQSTFIDEFHTTEDDVFVMSIAIKPDGSAYAIDEADNFYSLNLATAELTLITTLADGPFWAFAAHPITGVLYVTEADDVYTLATDGVLTPVNELDLQGTVVRSMQVDSSGVLWFINAAPEEPAELWSTASDATAPEFSGAFVEGELETYSQSLLIIPAPALAATGSELPVALIAGIGVLVLAGGVLLVRRRQEA